MLMMAVLVVVVRVVWITIRQKKTSSPLFESTYLFSSEEEICINCKLLCKNADLCIEMERLYKKASSVPLCAAVVLFGKSTVVVRCKWAQLTLASYSVRSTSPTQHYMGQWQTDANQIGLLRTHLCYMSLLACIRLLLMTPPPPPTPTPSFTTTLQ